MDLFTRFSKEIPNIKYYTGEELKFRLSFLDYYLDHIDSSKYLGVSSI